MRRARRSSAVPRNKLPREAGLSDATGPTAIGPREVGPPPRAESPHRRWAGSVGQPSQFHPDPDPMPKTTLSRGRLCKEREAIPPDLKHNTEYLLYPGCLSCVQLE